MIPFKPAHHHLFIYFVVHHLDCIAQHRGSFIRCYLCIITTSKAAQHFSLTNVLLLFFLLFVYISTIIYYYLPQQLKQHKGFYIVKCDVHGQH